MNVGGIRVELPRILRRCVVEVFVFRGGYDVDVAVFLGFLDSFFGPLAGVQVVGRGLAAQQVHRNHRELAGGAALQE